MGSPASQTLVTKLKWHGMPEHKREAGLQVHGRVKPLQSSPGFWIALPG